MEEQTRSTELSAYVTQSLQGIQKLTDRVFLQKKISKSQQDIL